MWPVCPGLLSYYLGELVWCVSGHVYVFSPPVRLSFNWGIIREEGQNLQRKLTSIGHLFVSLINGSPIVWFIQTWGYNCENWNFVNKGDSTVYLLLFLFFLIDPDIVSNISFFSLSFRFNLGKTNIVGILHSTRYSQVLFYSV